MDEISCGGIEIGFPLSPPPYSSVGLVRAYLDADANLHLQFNGSTRVLPNGYLHITPAEESARYAWRVPFYDGGNIGTVNLTVRARDLIAVPSIKRSYFLPPVPTLTNLRWNTRYAICNGGALSDDEGVHLPRLVGHFTSSPPPSLLVNQARFDADGLVQPILLDTVLARRIRVDLRSANFYNFTAAVHMLNGTGMRIGLYDSGILNASEVAPAVAWRALEVADEDLDQYAGFNASRPGSIANHATNMARYLLNFAPGAALYDFQDMAPNHLEQEIAAALRRHGVVRHPSHVNSSRLGLGEYAQLARMLNLSVLSHSGGTDIDNATVAMIGRAVQDGLIFAKSIGNDHGYPNRIADKRCVHDETFIPYMWNLTASRGAFVALQAVTAHPAPTGIRARADDAAPYTLTMYENGNGATSEATATFAGMMALMLQANQLYAANFTPRQLVEIMIETADLIPHNRPVFGHGIVNMGRAVARVQRRVAPTFRLYANITASPLFLNHTFDLSDGDDECVRFAAPADN